MENEKENKNPAPAAEPTPSENPAPAAEPTPSENPAPAAEPTPAPSLNDTVKKIKNQYESKISQMNEKYSVALKERDDIIAQLLTGEAEKPAPAAQSRFIDEINEKRTFKKW